MELYEKEVYFGEWCPKCVNHDKPETEDPCWDCLDNPMNIESHKPLYFKEGTHVTKTHGTFSKFKKRSK